MIRAPSFAAILVAAAGVALPIVGCNSGFPVPRGNTARLEVLLSNADAVSGKRLQPLPLVVNTPQPFKITVRALNRDGEVDTTYSGFVRISAKPGAIERIASRDADGRSLKLTSGVSPETEIRITNAYGTTYIIADDLGYAPADPLGNPRPACANGIDDDGDGRIDFPTDEGCAFANDDSEQPGGYSQGQSQPIYYALPRIADMRGLICNAEGKCSGNGRTPYPKEAIVIDTGLHDRPNGGQGFDFDVVVTRIASDGFYVTDLNDQRGGFTSVFSFNFNAPPRMRVCDRLKAFAGTASEFFGFTQVSYPTWTLEEWDPQKRPCLVPEAETLSVVDIKPPIDPGTQQPIDTVEARLLPKTGSFVRVATIPGVYEMLVTPKMGEKNMIFRNAAQNPQPHPCDRNKDGIIDFTLGNEEGVCASVCLRDPNCREFASYQWISGPEATNCDFNKDGTIEFDAGDAEGACAQGCQADPECTEWSNFFGRGTFRLTVRDLRANGRAGAIQADASTFAAFKALDFKGKPLKSFAGTLHYFSGGNQFTIQARCADDVVIDLAAEPLPSDKACVVARLGAEESPQ